MTEKQFCKGDYTNCWYDICEIEKDGEIICTVALKDADFIIEILKENEKLKKELRIYRKLASCENCGHHNYDWFDDGDEFEVCEKGNDMTDRICEDWWEL